MKKKKKKKKIMMMMMSASNQVIESLSLPVSVRRTAPSEFG